jgi:RecB family exonuclease
VHAVLEETWRELKTHAALCSRPDIDEVVARSVDGAIERFERERGRPLPARFAALERQRLRRLTADWLEVDRERESFEVIEPEEDKYAETGGVRFRVKIDRVDRLADGREMIVDYKTGITSPRSWESDRPEEPQLPLYGTIHEKPLAGVLYARVRAGDLRFIGLVDDGVTLPGCEQVDLGAKVDRWRAVLERIGGEFREGRAEVDPRDGDRTCRYCPLGSLCRVSECPAAGAGDEGEIA